MICSGLGKWTTDLKVNGLTGLNPGIVVFWNLSFVDVFLILKIKSKAHATSFCGI